MHYINYQFDFTARTKWAWPESDDDLKKVIKQVDDIDYIMEFVDNKKTCIQAGGACGIWPLRFSQLFDIVYTFEPNSKNYLCLLDNTRDAGNILAYKVALWRGVGRGALRNPPTELYNAGAGYFVPGVGTVRARAVDSFDIESVGLMQLDVEGREYDVLLGAMVTLNRSNPVVVIEEKKLPQFEHAQQARELLESIGYRQVGKIHRDVIFKR